MPKYLNSDLKSCCQGKERRMRKKRERLRVPYLRRLQLVFFGMFEEGLVYGWQD